MRLLCDGRFDSWQPRCSNVSRFVRCVPLALRPEFVGRRQRGIVAVIITVVIAEPAGLVVRVAQFRLLDFTVLGDLAVAKIADDFQYLAARWEHAATASLVFVQRLHEFDFAVRVISFAGRRIDLSSSLDLAATVRASLALDRLYFRATIRFVTSIIFVS